MKKSLIIYKNKTYKKVEGDTEAYEKDENFFMTIPIEPVDDEEDRYDLFLTIPTVKLFKLLSEAQKDQNEYKRLNPIK